MKDDIVTSLLCFHSLLTTSYGRWMRVKAAWPLALILIASLTTCSPTRTETETEKSQRRSSNLKQMKPLPTMSYDGTECKSEIGVLVVKGQSGKRGVGDYDKYVSYRVQKVYKVSKCGERDFAFSFEDWAGKGAKWVWEESDELVVILFWELKKRIDT